MKNISLDKLKQADRRTLGKAITLLESTRSDHRQLAEQLLDKIMPFTGEAIRIGITGVPGVGKSTFIDVFGEHVIRLGHRIAVLTVDPSSSVNGGSILGDKTRMPRLAANPSAFIRPSPTGTSLGGVARRTREAILVCEAAGYDVIVVETVGVGQSETVVADMADLFLLMLLPGAGDDLQGIKRGIMEFADIVVVNKADGDMLAMASVSISDLQHALQLMKPRLAGWKVPVLTTSALKNQGIEEVWQHIGVGRYHLDQTGLFDLHREKQAIKWLWQEASDLMLDRLRADSSLSSAIQGMQQSVSAGKIASSVAASRLVARFLEKQ